MFLIPVIYLDSSEPGWRCVIAEGTVTSFGPKETRQYEILFGRWRSSLGEHNRWIYTPRGQGEPD